MIGWISDYFSRLTQAFGEGWTRFWFTPSDPATLSLMRVLLGAIVVYLHATLLPDLVPLFGPQGMLPAAEIAPIEGGAFSYLNYLSSPGELWTVHLMGLAVLILFTIGFWTRLTAVGALIVFLSDVHRAPMITGRAEVIAAMLLAYLCLAPSGARFSVDRWLALRAGKPALPTPPSTLATISTRLIQVHLALLIGMMGFSKLAGEPWWNGTGVWWLITRPESRLVDFTWLHRSPQLLEAWSHAIVAFELIFAVLIWVPLARPLLLFAGVLIWTSLALVTGDIPWALLMGVASLAFVSPDTLQTCLHSPPNHLPAVR